MATKKKVKRVRKWAIVSASGRTLGKFYFKKYALNCAKCFRTKVIVKRLDDLRKPEETRG